jgi:hypothetical protein
MATNINREDVVGRTITHILRDDVEIDVGKPFVTGISTGVRKYFHVFLELDHNELMEVGMDRRYYPLEFVPITMRGKLTDLDIPEEVPTCVNETIEDVLIHYEQITFRLSSGRYFWVVDDLQGTEIRLDSPDDLSTEKMKDYWSPVE